MSQEQFKALFISFILWYVKFLWSIQFTKNMGDTIPFRDSEVTTTLICFYSFAFDYYDPQPVLWPDRGRLCKKALL